MTFPAMPDTDDRQNGKAAKIAADFIDLYGPVAELQVAHRVAMFEAEGDDAAVAAWRAVGQALGRLRAA